MSNDNLDATTKIKRKVKAHLPKDWLADIRILYRISIETIKGILRAGWVVNLAIISTMAVALTVFGVLLRSSFSLSAITDSIGKSVEISVYLKNSANVQKSVEQIKKIEHVKNVKIITKEQAWNTMKMKFTVADVDNPLPNTLHVRVDNPNNIEEISKIINKYETVESINYARDIAKKIQIIVNVVHAVIIIVALISALFTITIINNTIHLVIQSRKVEIEIMRLMGVSNWYIKTPLIFQGAIYGFLGTVIATFFLYLVHNMWLSQLHEFLSIPMPEFALNIVIFTMFIVAIGFGSAGSFLSIKKYLSV